MPLHILLLLVVGGIFGIAALLHVTGQSAQHILSDEGEAKDHWNQTYPESPALCATLATLRQAALIKHTKGYGLIWPMGQDVAAREIAPDAVSFYETAQHLVVKTHDFTAPKIKLALSADEQAVWRATLEQKAS